MMLDCCNVVTFRNSAIAAYKRLHVEANQATKRARVQMSLIAQMETNFVDKTIREMTHSIIVEHISVDIFTRLEKLCRLIEDQSHHLIALRRLPDNKGLVIAIATIIFASNRIKVQEFKRFSLVLQKLYGMSFTNLVLENRNGLCDKFLIKKLTTSVSSEMIDRYIEEIRGKSRPDIRKSKSGQMLSTKEKRQNLAVQVPSLSIDSKCVSPKTDGCNISITSLAPLLPIRTIKLNERLQIAFDIRTKNPVYSLHRLDGSERTTPTSRHSFFEEKRLPSEYRSKLCTFLHSGFDRGHLAPSADFGDDAKDTYNLCNISPQNKEMNRSLWAKLENWIRRVAKCELKKGAPDKVIYIVTGPVWIPNAINKSNQEGTKSQLQFEVLGSDPTSMIFIPTHFFKILVVLERGKIHKFECFLIPNSIPAEEYKLMDYVATWDQIELCTGLQFFPSLIDKKWKAAASAQCGRLLRSYIEDSLKKGSSNYHETHAIMESLKHLNL